MISSEEDITVIGNTSIPTIKVKQVIKLPNRCDKHIVMLVETLAEYDMYIFIYYFNALSL